MDFKKYRYFASLITLIILSGCEKVIDIELNTSNPQIVIESRITQFPGEIFVIVTKTTDYFTPRVPDGVTNAMVNLFNQNGHVGALSHQGNGSYVLQSFTAIPGDTYRMTVEVDGQTYEASAKMPQVVPIDTVIAVGVDDISFFYTDPTNEINYYRFSTEIINHDHEDEFVEFDSELHLLSDEFFNGNYIEQSILEEGDFDASTYEPGDSILVTFRSINEGSYDYYRTIENATGSEGPFSTAPANPLSNWSNGALGVMELSANEIRLIVVP